MRISTIKICLFVTFLMYALVNNFLKRAKDCNISQENNDDRNSIFNLKIVEQCFFLIKIYSIADHQDRNFMYLFKYIKHIFLIFKSKRILLSLWISIPVVFYSTQYELNIKLSLTSYLKIFVKIKVYYNSLFLSKKQVCLLLISDVVKFEVFNIQVRLFFFLYIMLFCLDISKHHMHHLHAFIHTLYKLIRSIQYAEK